MSNLDSPVLQRATQHFANRDPSPDQQTLITLFLQGVKSANFAVLSKVILFRMDWVPFRFLHEQCFKELELVSLLAKATAWSPAPAPFSHAMNLNLKLMQTTNIRQFMMGMFSSEESFYEYIVLSHAFMSQIRLMPLFPPSRPLDTPFLNAISDIEVQNGRMIQTQIRMLKDMPVNLTMEQREALVEQQAQAVRVLFDDLLTAVCDMGDEADRQERERAAAAAAEG